MAFGARFTFTKSKERKNMVKMTQAEINKLTVDSVAALAELSIRARQAEKRIAALTGQNTGDDRPEFFDERAQRRNR